MQQIVKTKPPILIVDDDLGFRKTLSDILRFKGYLAITVDTGQAALEKISLHKPLVALIDLKLEDMSGLDLLKTLKEQNTRQIECILLTGYATQKSAIEAVNLGAYGYMQKPYDVEQLLVMIRRATEKLEAEEALWAYARRLELLREIDQAILEAHSPEAIAQAALHRMRFLIPCERASVIAFDFVNNEGLILAINGAKATKLRGGVRLPLAAFTLSEELKQGQLRLVENIGRLAQPTQTDRLLQAEGIQAYVTIPLISQGELLGLLSLEGTSVETFAVEQIEIAQEVARLLAVVLQQTRLDEQVQRHAAALEQRVVQLQQAQEAERKQRELAETLREVTGALNTSLDQEQVLRLILEQLARVVNYEGASVMLVSNGMLHIVAGRSLNPRPRSTIQFRVESVAHIQQVLQQRVPVIISDTAADPRWLPVPGTELIRCWLGVPLIVQDRVIGLLNLSQREANYYTQQDAELAAAFAAQAAIAVENAQLFEQAHQEIEERMRAETALAAERTSLARRVEERTAELKAANTELARASRLKDEFLASMSHELRTPLNAILGLSEALQEEVYGSLNDKQLKTLNTIEESGRHLLALINDILDVSKIEAGKLTLQEEWISVEEVCQASLRLIRQTAQKKMLKLSYTRAEEVDTIYADLRRLKQILVNLLSNAVKFTPNEATIGLEVKNDPINRATLFSVWDTGIGIAPENVDRLFQTFVQIDSSLTRQHSGSGLGLTLVRRLTELHGGQVWLESQPGQGSRFTVSLPWPELYKTLEEITTGTIELKDQANPLLQRALIVEDSTTTAEQLARYLAEMGLESFIHHRAEGVLEIVQRVRPDVIILDILLPDLSGWEVLNRLKQEDSARSIPVIVISIIDEPAQGSILEVVEYLVKPISRQQLQASLVKILASKETEGMVVLPSEPPRILLVEDNLNNIETISQYLVNKGYHLLVAHNGHEAIERARADCPDLILMDIQMPGMDGLEAIRHIRADKTQSVATVSIIALTALSMPGDRERCLQAGANEYLSKPISLKELAKVIEKQLT